MDPHYRNTGRIGLNHTGPGRTGPIHAFLFCACGVSHCAPYPSEPNACRPGQPCAMLLVCRESGPSYEEHLPIGRFRSSGGDGLGHGRLCD
jgi:hypothetical protein